MAWTDVLQHWGYCLVMSIKLKWAEDGPCASVKRCDNETSGLHSSGDGFKHKFTFHTGKSKHEDLFTLKHLWVLPVVKRKLSCANHCGLLPLKPSQRSLGISNMRGSARALNCRRKDLPDHGAVQPRSLLQWGLFCQEPGTLMTAKYLSSVCSFSTNETLPYVEYLSQS